MINFIKKNLTKFFSLLTICTYSAAAHSAPLLLQCDVKGTFTSSADSIQTPLSPTKVLSTIEFINDHIFIDIDGPSEYSVGTTSAPYEREGRKSAGRNTSTDNSYGIQSNTHNSVTGYKSEYNISVNRITGLLTVRHTGTSSKNVSATVEYSGYCQKSTSNDRKF